MKRTRRQWLDESYRWMREHVSPTNLDVPDELLNAWLFDNEGDEKRPAGFHFTVFVFGYIQHRILARGESGPNRREQVMLSELLERFDRWQYKLALVEVHRRTGYAIDPLPLFAFPEGETITITPRP